MSVYSARVNRTYGIDDYDYDVVFVEAESFEDAFKKLLQSGQVDWDGDKAEVFNISVRRAERVVG